MDFEEARQHAATNQPGSSQPDVKRHTACDGCRHRKLKCSGDKPQCGRCVREKISCIYSPQKQMGRPRKRRRDDVSSIALSPTHQHGGSGGRPIMMSDAAAASASPSALRHMGGVSNGGGGINSHHSPFTPPSVGRQELEVLVAGFDGGVSTSCSNPGVPARALMYSGFEGFSFDADEVAAAPVATSVAAAGEDMMGFGSVPELEPGFSLNPVLDIFGGDGAADVGRQGTQFDQHQSQSLSHSHSHSRQFSRECTSAGGSATCSSNLSIDGTSSYHTPPLLPQHHQQPLIMPPLQPQCVCLSSMYLTMTSLHSLSNHDFPFVLPTLRSAINTIAAIIPCPQCPKRAATATQNLQMLVTLLLTVVESIRSTIFSIDAEAARVEAAGATKVMGMADIEAPMHIHTGTPDCPARFSMELNGPDWRLFVRKALRDQIVGSPQYPGDRTLYGILMSLEDRQRRWHEDPQLNRMRQKMFGEHATHDLMVEPENRLCIKYIEHIRLVIDMLALDV